MALNKILGANGSETCHLRRLPGAANSLGVEYEWKLAGLLALRAHLRGLPFRLFSNVEVARPFDDLVLQLLNPKRTFLIQIKHSRDPQKCVGEQALTSDRGDFSLLKYFQFYEKLCLMHHNPSDDDERLLSQNSMDCTRFLIYTTRDFTRLPSTQQNESMEFEELFHTSGAGKGDAFSFNESNSKIWGLINNDADRQHSFRHGFLSKLRVYYKQALSDELNGIIKKEMNGMFGEDTEKCLTAFLDFLKKWSEDDNQSFCLTNETFHNLLDQQLRVRALSAIGRNLVFKAESLDDLRKALRSSTSNLCVTVCAAPAPGRRAAKLLQVLSEEFGDRWMYVDGGILRGFPKDVLVAAAKRAHFLVTDVEDGSEDEELALDLVVAARGEVREVSLRSAAVRSIFFQDKWCLADLSDAAQEKLLQRSVNFQGCTVILKEMKRIWPSLYEDIHADIIISLDKGETLRIGKDIPNPGEHFLPRRIAHHSLVSAKILMNSTSFMALSGFPRALLSDAARQRGLSSLEDNDRWTVLNFQGEAKPFIDENSLKSLATKRKETTVNLLEYVSGNSLENLVMIWRMCVGDENSMKTFIDCINEKCKKYPLCIHDNTSSLWTFHKALLVGEAGVGKTTAIKSVATELKKDDPLQWVIVVKILDRRDLLQKWQKLKELSLEHVIQLVAAAAGAESGVPRRCLEAALRNSGAASIFVDGVDEVAPAFKDQALRFLQLLGERNIRHVWAASRPEVESSLRFALQSPPLTLQPFTYYEQKQFLCSRFTKSGSCDSYQTAEDVVQWLGKDASGLLATPLHLQMAAEAFSMINSEQQGIIVQKTFSLLELYNLFVERKRLLYQERHLNNVPIANLPFEDDFEQMHEKCAMYFLFSAGWFGEELSRDEFENYVNTSEKILKGKEKSGIMWMDEDRKLHFIHQTFAEYFAAKWLWENAHSSDIYRHFVQMISNKYNQSQLLVFLKQLLAEEYPLHAAAWHKDLISLERKHGNDASVKEQWDQKDKMLQWGVIQYLKLAYDQECIKSDQVTWLVRALIEASAGGCEEVAYELLRRNGGIKRGSNKIARLVQKYQVMSAVPPKAIDMALQEAAKGATASHTRVVSILLDCSVSGMTISQNLLHLAAEAANVHTMEKLLPYFESINTLDSSGCTPLHYAIGGKWEGFNMEHKHEATQWLLQLEEVDVNAINGDGRKPLECAASVSCINCVKHLLDLGADINGAGGLPPLAASAQYNNSEIFRFLLDKKANPNASNADHVTPLHCAAACGNIQSLQLLLSHGACVNVIESGGNTPLHLAAKEGHFRAVQVLLLNGAHVNVANAEGSTALHLAKRHANVIKELLSHGASVNATNEEGSTPLKMIKYFDESCEETMKLLLDAGADPLYRDCEGQSAWANEAKSNIWDIYNPCNFILRNFLSINHSEEEIIDKWESLRTGIKRKDIEVLRYPLRDSIDPNEANINGESLLYLTVKSGFSDAVKLLLKNCPAIKAVSADGWSPVHVAALKGRTEVMELLLQADESIVNARAASGITPLHLAVQEVMFVRGHERKPELVDLLLRRGADPLAATTQGATPAHLAARTGNAAALALLLAADPSCANAATRLGWTPLHEAVARQHRPVVKALAGGAADLGCRDRFGRSAVDLAVGRGGDEEVVRFLLARVAQSARAKQYDLIKTVLCYPKKKDNFNLLGILIESGVNPKTVYAEGKTLLHLATKSRQIEYVDILLKHRAFVNAATVTGLTPLHLAGQAGFIEAIKALLAHGAKVNRVTKSGLTTLHMATYKGHVNSVKLLLRSGADKSIQDVGGKTAADVALQQRQIACVEILSPELLNTPRNNEEDVNCDDEISLATLDTCGAITEALSVLDECESEAEKKDIVINMIHGVCKAD